MTFDPTKSFTVSPGYIGWRLHQDTREGHFNAYFSTFGAVLEWLGTEVPGDLAGVPQ